MVPPEINTEHIRIQEGGDLPKGFYYYALTKVDRRGNESYPHVIQVHARYSGNIISLCWNTDPLVDEYRLYRGTSLAYMDGYFTVFDTGVDQCEFHDDGTGVLNEYHNLQL